MLSNSDAVKNNSLTMFVLHTKLTVDGETKFACVDGPDFDGFGIDFDEAMDRCRMYKDFEAKAREETCNLFKMEVK